LSARGRQVIVDADHGMSQSPESIVTAVREVVDDVRANNTSPIAVSNRVK